MRQLTGPTSRTEDTWSLKCLRALVVFAALLWLAALSIVRVGFVAFALLVVYGLFSGIATGTWSLVVVSALALLAITRVPRREIAVSISAFKCVAVPFLKCAFPLISAYMVFLLAVGILQGDGGLVIVGILGLVPRAAYLIARQIGSPDPHHPRHIEGTSLISEEEAIRRAQKIRSPTVRTERH